jgi:phytoene desaturase
MKDVVIIGSGIGGLASAIRFRNKGYNVTVLEQNKYPGGKLTEIKLNAFRFDAGPSLFTMPELIEELFTLSGKNIKDYFEYDQLTTICNYFFEDGTIIKAHADPLKFAQEIENKTTDSKSKVLAHLKKSAFIYQTTNQLFLNKSLHKLKSYLSLNTFVSFLKLPFINPFKTMDEVNKKQFNDEKNRLIFNRYATYNGSNPYKAPAILNLIPHLEFNKGAYFPKNGMISITNALYQLSKEIGVEFHFNQKVEHIVTDSGQTIKGVKTTSDFFKANKVVCNTDVKNVYQDLLPDSKQLQKVLKQERSSSALIFYWGISQTFEALNLHNIFFSKDYKKEFDAIFNQKNIYNDPTIYINITSKYNSNDAPKGSENWFVMINVPSDNNQNWEDLIATAKKNIIIKLNRILKVNLEDIIVEEAQLTPKLIELKTSSYKGSLYGTASNNRMAAFFRHPNFSKQYPNLYFCGGSVHPGGGIPLALSSAKIIDKYIKNVK